MKEPHNYRKVGYSMIVISVSLVAIGLIVWAIGDNYHYSSDLMAGQEINSMTPKNGYNIVSFDDSQPVGAKLKMLDHAETNTTAFTLQGQYSNSASTIMIFDSSVDDNSKLVADAKLKALQIAQEKATAAAKANQESQNTSSTTSVPPTAKANTTSTNIDNGTIMMSQKLNNTNNNSTQAGQGTMALSGKVNTTSTDVNQTTTNGTNKSVRLSENVGIASK